MIYKIECYKRIKPFFISHEKPQYGATDIEKNAWMLRSMLA